MVTVAPTAVHTVMLAVEQGVVGSAGAAVVADTDAEAQTVVSTLHDLAVRAPAPQPAVAELVFVVALLAVAVTAGEIAAESVLGTLDVVVVLAAVSAVQTAFLVAAVALQLPAAVIQAVPASVAVAVVVAVAVALVVAVSVAVAVVGLAWPPG